MSVICTVFNWMYVAFFPSIHKESEKMSKLFESYPQDFMKILDVDIKGLFTSLEAFLAAENFSIMWPIIMIIFVVALGGSMIAKEVEGGTIEFLLAQPISRLKLFFAKYIGNVISIFLFVVFSIWTIIPFALIYNVDFQAEAFLVITVLGLLFGFAVFAVTTLFSSIFSTSGKVASISAGILIFMYGVKIFSSLKESAENLKYLSFFHYFDHNAALIDQTIDVSSILVFSVVTIVATVAGAVYFAKRDLAV